MSTEPIIVPKDVIEALRDWHTMGMGYAPARSATYEKLGYDTVKIGDTTFAVDRRDVVPA